ncbi:MAG: 30S ribosomal protein S20 [Planctomycetaceae bacterium]
MPITSSAKRALRKSKVRRDRNRTQRTALRTVIKKCRAAVGTADADAAFKLAVKRLDQAAAKNLIHANNAARTKSRLSKLMKAAKAAPSGEAE